MTEKYFPKKLCRCGGGKRMEKWLGLRGEYFPRIEVANSHCAESVRILSYSGAHLPTFGTE